METNQYFSLTRLWMVTRRYAVENRNILLLGAGLILGLMVIIGAVLGFQASEDWAESQVETATGVYLTVTAIAAVIFASGLFSSLNTPSGAVTFLTLPATPYEICLSRWLFAVPGCILWCYACMWVAEATRIGIGLLVGVETIYRIPFGSLFSQDYNPGLKLMPILFLKSILTLQSFFILGSILWRGQNLIKTIGALAAIGVILYLTSTGVTLAFLFVSARIPMTFYLSPGSFIPGWVCYIVIVFNYVLTLIRLREAEVIQRW